MNMNVIAVFGPKHGSQVLSLPSHNNLFPQTKLACLRATSFPSNLRKCVRLKATSTHQESNHTFKKLQPSEWTHRFHSVPLDVSEMDALREEIDALKPKVKNEFMSSQGINSTKKKILLIYLLVSLGLAYYFEEEIFETLEEGFKKIEEMMASEDDLYSVSTIFWVFRTYGYYISSDVFTRFKGDSGHFKKSLTGDAKGMLSLYEAAHLRTAKDPIMDEALSFTSSHLESLAASGTCQPHLSNRIRSVLHLSQRWNLEMLFAAEYISFYEQEKDHDEMLLKFAKLNFKLLQLQYVQELKIVTKWYKEVELSSKLPPYFRERIVEHHFFTQGVFFEPELSRARIMLSQYLILLVIQDDTLDRYASLPEAESLVNSLERWAPDHAMDKQPDYLKFVFNFILETFNELERQVMAEGESHVVKATIEEYKKLVKANFEVEKWAQAAHVPSFDKYLKVGMVGVAVCTTLAGIFMSGGKMSTKEDYEWLKSRPKLVQSLCIKGRLMNDITGYEDDMSRGYVTNAINCYMKQYGVTKEEAFRELHKMVADADKTVNEELLMTTGVSRLALKAAIGVARMVTISYNGYEGYTCPEGKIKEYMTSMFIDQIPL